MKRVGLLLMIMFGVLALFGCSQEQGNLEPVNEEVAASAEAFVNEYKDVMIKESNEGSFHDIEEYLIPNSTFYHTLRRYMQDLTQNFQRLSLISHEVNRVQKNEIDEYYVDAVEKVEITDRRGTKTLEETKVTYILVEFNGKYRVMTILKRK